MAAFLRSDEDVFAELLAQKTNADIIAEKKYMEAELRALLRELIDHIDVYETEGTGKNRTQRIMIHYKFVGVIEIPDSSDNYTADTRKRVAVEYFTRAHENEQANRLLIHKGKKKSSVHNLSPL